MYEMYESVQNFKYDVLQSYKMYLFIISFSKLHTKQGQSKFSDLVFSLSFYYKLHHLQRYMFVIIIPVIGNKSIQVNMAFTVYS